MSTISAYDAKTHFSSLLERAGDGETVVITKHGRPVAKLVPFDVRPAVDDLVDALLEARKGVRLDGLHTRDLIENGRRY
ncbi:type II toxin-antitoxin system prevent-host-death family antitoxin [Agromyces sp. H66]|uniref:type II toxin-antitoxin system Phd/YefM family antitoxin n=1 Tax=Agromyces sp. H66 TaxID=2529859 RepID=UPI0010AACE2C|nr:type II toxin-antitoxin system prevent-host-death family antitoxin [Agromyces sp. H66]